MLPQQREEIILSWFLGMNAAEAAMKGQVINEDIVETIPENVNNACLYAECKAVFHKIMMLKKVEAILTIKQKVFNYYCTICELEINDDQVKSVNCSSCLEWMHFKCTGLKSSLKKVLVMLSLLQHYNVIDLNPK